LKIGRKGAVFSAYRPSSGDRALSWVKLIAEDVFVMDRFIKPRSARNFTTRHTRTDGRTYVV
ncbi:hypothetical protein N9H39_12040, partial [Gammaproteobacteria bacterium]|nr:hypothetical protein [Gammaproteobacteria bacterium]